MISYKIKSAKSRMIFLLILISILFTGCLEIADSNYPSIDKGKVNLRQWDFSRDGNIKLDGEWEFYWNKLLTYKDLEGETPDLFANVPNTWNTYLLNGEELPGEGYATYRLHVATDLPAGTRLGLRIYTFSSAYNLYINESLVASNGRVATTVKEEVGEYRPQAVFFDIPASEFDIIINVSNFHYARGGFWYSMSMGDAKGILTLHDSLMGKEAFLIGALLIISLFFIAIFILRLEYRYTLYFALLCIFIVVAIDMVGQFIIPRFFPGISLNAILFMWYTSTTWVLFFLILYVHELFPSKFSEVIVKVYLVVDSLFQLLYVFTPPVYYSQFAHISNYIDIVGVLCTVVIVAIGIKNGQKSGWLNITSIFIVLITYIHDILYWTNIIRNDFGEIYYGGLFLFILLQMVIQAQRIKIFHEQKTAAELAFLQAQIKPHFLFNALNTFISISHYDMDKARNLLANFSHYLRGSFDFKGLSQFVPLKNEISLAKAYVEIEKARFEERLEVNFEVQEDLEAKVPKLTLQPLIENAVIHGILPKPEGGRIDVSVNDVEGMLIFRIKDNGIGMAAEKLNRYWQYDSRKGVGLANIDNRLRKLFGKGLNIKSNPGIGTEITWIIPIKKGGVISDDESRVD